MKAETEWEKVLDALRSIGPAWTPYFDDALTSRAIENMGGWARVCGDLDRKALRMRFYRAYIEVENQ